MKLASSKRVVSCAQARPHQRLALLPSTDPAIKHQRRKKIPTISLSLTSPLRGDRALRARACAHVIAQGALALGARSFARRRFRVRTGPKGFDTRQPSPPLPTPPPSLVSTLSIHPSVPPLSVSLLGEIGGVGRSVGRSVGEAWCWLPQARTSLVASVGGL